MVGKRVEIDGELAKATFYATGRSDAAGWCLTVPQKRPKVLGTSELAFDGQAVPVEFRTAQAPPERTTRARVVGKLDHDGTQFVLRDATWTAVPH